MNPNLKAIPPVSPGLDLATVFSPESSLRALVQQYNLLTYIDYEERLPDAATLKKDLRHRGLEGASSVDVLLWILGHTYEVLPIPLTPEVTRFADLHFLANNKSVIESFSRSLLQDAGLLYHQLHGESATMGAMRQVGGSIAYYRDMTNDHRRLYMLCRALSVIQDYRDLFQRQPELMRQEMVRLRRHDALRVLETLLQRQSAAASAAQTAQGKEAGVAAPDAARSAVQAAPPGIEPASAAAKPPVRAVDLPEWREFEAGQSDGLDWGTVMRIFGGEMVVRILLRRHDYQQLLAMMEARFLSDPSDLRYCLRSMQKIVDHHDLAEEHEEAYLRVHRFIEAALQT